VISLENYLRKNTGTCHIRLFGLHKVYAFRIPAEIKTNTINNLDSFLYLEKG